MTYSIAGFDVELNLPQDVAKRLLPTMEPFRAPASGDPLCRIQISDSPSLPQPKGELLGDYPSDTGRVLAYRDPAGYLLIVSYPDGTEVAVVANPAFTSALVALSFSAPLAGEILAAAIRLVFTQAITPYQAFAIHASCTVAEGMAYLFCGVSGAGKSTHSAMWLRAIPGAWLLNDDCVIVRLDEDGTPRAYGSPWSGKTPCYRAACAPVAAMVRVDKAPANSYEPLSDIAAFGAVLPGVSAMRAEGDYFAHVCDTLAATLNRIQVGIIHCQAVPEAAVACHQGLSQKSKVKSQEWKLPSADDTAAGSIGDHPGTTVPRASGASIVINDDSIGDHPGTTVPRASGASIVINDDSIGDHPGTTVPRASGASIMINS